MMNKYGLLLALFIVLSPSVGIAKEKPEWRSWPMGDRMVGAISGYRPHMNTQAFVSDEDGNLGVGISFEDSLGLENKKTVPLAYASWRISKRNAVSIDYFKLDRNNTQNSFVLIRVPTGELPPDDTTDIKAELPISALFNIQSIDITYAFSVLFTEKTNLALGLGLALQELEFGIAASDDCDIPQCDNFGAPRTAKSTAPLPTFKVIWQYAFTEKWLLDTSIGYFALELDLDSNEKLEGSIWNAGATVRWKTWKNFGFNAGYKFFDVDIDYQKRSLIAGADYDYRGFTLGIEAFF
jgi:hypothetical protein